VRIARNKEDVGVSVIETSQGADEFTRIATNAGTFAGCRGKVNSDSLSHSRVINLERVA
jgi:hypothetical protein